MIEPDLVRRLAPEELHFPLTDWMSQAACAGKDFLWDHNAGTDGNDRASQHAQAIAICQGCPVLALCDSYANQNDLVGVWGGRCRSFRTNAGPLACGSCHRDAQLSKSTELTNRRRERNAAAERTRYAAMSPEEKAVRRARRYATPDLREAARVRHLAWKAKRTAEQKAQEKILDSERYYRKKASSC